MDKTALFVGDRNTLYHLSGFEFHFKKEGFQIIQAETFEEALKIIKNQIITIAIIYGYDDYLSKPIDEYTGTLPPIIYWHNPQFDQVPQRSGVMCVRHDILREKMMEIANQLINQPQQ